MYGQPDWASLKSVANKTIPKHEYLALDTDVMDALEYTPIKPQFEMFVKLVEPHSNKLKKHIQQNTTGVGSILKSVADREFHNIPGHYIHDFFHEFEGDKISFERLLSTLTLMDDSTHRFIKCMDKPYYKLNTHLEPKVFRQSFYAYFTFNKSNVEILSREWDIGIARPTLSSHKVRLTLEEQITNSQLVTNRPWFVEYMISYLRILVNDFCSHGYSGTITITKIMNYPISAYVLNIPHINETEGLKRLYDKLLNNILPKQHNKIDVLDHPDTGAIIQFDKNYPVEW